MAVTITESKRTRSGMLAILAFLRVSGLIGQNFAADVGWIIVQKHLRINSSQDQGHEAEEPAKHEPPQESML